MGEDVKRFVNNYKVALDILTSLMPNTQQADTEVNTEPTKEQQVRTILHPLFNDSGEFQFNSLIDHITADKRPENKSVIIFSGKKEELYTALRELKKYVKRQRLLEVFTDIELKIGLDYYVLNKKI